MNNDNLQLHMRISPLLGRLRRKPVVLCIGSDRVTGDALGPIVGHLLTTAAVPAFVYGSLSAPVTALNLAETLETVRLRHPGSKIIAIDSSIGEENEVGLVHVFRGGIKPGAADGKKLPRVGDISITATVAANTHKNLYSVRLGLVFSLAASIAESLLLVLGKKEESVTA